MPAFYAPSTHQTCHFYTLHVLNRIISCHITSEFDSLRREFVPNRTLRFIYLDSEVWNLRSKFQQMDAASLEAEKEKEVKDEMDRERSRLFEMAASKAVIRCVGILGQCGTSLPTDKNL